MLLDFGANTNTTTKEGKTPIDLAIHNKDIKLFEFLLLLVGEEKNTAQTLQTELQKTPLYQMDNILKNKGKLITSHRIPFMLKYAKDQERTNS